MLTESTISGLRALIHLVKLASPDPVSPRQIADLLGLSPTYLAKVTRQLVRANILRAFRGAKGGVKLGRAPEEVTLLQIVEACQGRILHDYCEQTSRLRQTCAFHQAMVEVHISLLETLSRWTLAQLAAKAGPSPSLRKRLTCRMG